MHADALLTEISDYCRHNGLAETTFGRLAVNDGKLVNRLRTGGRVTGETLTRLRAFMSTTHAPQRLRPEPVAERASLSAPSTEQRDSQGNFRFYDNRQKYLLFVNTCSEKWVVADRVGARAGQPPSAPAGGAPVRCRRRRRHRAVARDARDARPLPDHAVLYRRQGDQPRGRAARAGEDARPFLRASGDRAGDDQSWPMPRRLGCTPQFDRRRRRAWSGTKSRSTGAPRHDFEQQITELQPFLAQNWRARASPKTGNPVYEKPVVLVIYRDDHRFLLDPVMPRRGAVRADYDLVIASQPYRARAGVEFKASRVIAPLARALGPGGRLLGIHCHGGDPGLEIIQKVWPGENPFTTDRHQLLAAVKTALGKAARNISFNADARTRARCSATTCTRCPTRSSATHRHLDAARGVERGDLCRPDRGPAPRRRDVERPLSRSDARRAAEERRAVVLGRVRTSSHGGGIWGRASCCRLKSAYQSPMPVMLRCERSEPRSTHRSDVILRGSLRSHLRMTTWVDSHNLL